MRYCGDQLGQHDEFLLYAMPHHSHKKMPARSDEGRYQLMELCPDGIFLLHRGRIVSANHAALHLAGCKRPEQVVGRPLSDFLRMAPEQASTDPPEIDIETSPVSCECELQLADGRIIDAALTVSSWPDVDASDTRMMMVRDLTALRRAEEALNRREREFRMLVEHSPDIISRIDRNMRHLYINPAVATLSDIPPSDWLGKTKAELGLPDSVVRAWDAAAQAAFDSGLEQKLTFDHMVDGKMRYFSGRVIPEIGIDGTVESVLGIAYEVTTHARMEKERDELLTRERTARIQAETSARARDEFLAIVSHELRAPLNGIQSWAHVLESYVKDVASAPLAQRALQGIKTGVGQQVRLIEDLLDVTRMMSGKLRLVKQPLPLRPVLEAAIESVSGLATAKHIRLHVDYRISSEQIDGDSDRIQQVFWNLLTNAIKFTADGGNVWLEAHRSDNEVVIVTRDDGIGIAPDLLPRLFNRFSQGDTSTTRSHSGLGLGLFLARYLLELHGGKVEARSPGEGKGTAFTVHLPLRVRSSKSHANGSLIAVDEEDLPLPSLGGLRILLVDDQEEARESITAVLSNAGAQVFAAGSAGQALTWLPTLNSDQYPHVLICDIAMPGEDGYSVLRKLRAWMAADGAAPLRHMPALALTAFAQREDRIRALTAGFQMHVTKPVAPEELIVVVNTMAVRR